MITSNRIPLLAGALGLAAAAIWAAQTHAALLPQYDRWNEFGAILGDSSIPHKLGMNLVERIERVGPGRYRVSGGKCHVPVTLRRDSPTSPQGLPMVGGSTVSISEVGNVQCE